MATLTNDMTKLLRKLEKRLGLIPLEPHFPEFAKKDKWADIIMEDTIVTFSRYYPHRFPMVINDDTCYKKKEDGTTYYYIKDEVLEGLELLGVMDIDWTNHTAQNASLGRTSLGGGYYYPSFACPDATLESLLTLQFSADIASLYNRGIYIDFQYPNRFALKGLGNVDYDLKSFVIVLLVQHCSLATISPTKMEIFEELAQADVANFLYENLKYYEGFETAYINIDLKLSELQDEGNKRENVIEKLKESYVSTSNDNIPYIMTV